MVPQGYVGTEEKANLTTGNMALLCWATLWISSRSSQIHSPGGNNNKMVRQKGKAKVIFSHFSLHKVTKEKRGQW